MAEEHTPEKCAAVVHLYQRSYKITVPIGTAKKIDLRDGDTVLLQISKLK